MPLTFHRGGAERLIYFMLLVCAVGGAQTEPAPETTLRDARAAAQDGDLAKAQSLFTALRERSHTDRSVEMEVNAVIGLLEVIDARLKLAPANQPVQSSAQQSSDLLRVAQELGSPAQQQAALNLAALIHLRVGDTTGGLQLLEQVKMDQTDPGERYVYHYDLGKAYELNGFSQRALDEYVESIRQQPLFPPAVDAAFALAAKLETGSAETVRICRAVADGADAEPCWSRATKLWSRTRESGDLLAALVDNEAGQAKNLADFLHRIQPFSDGQYWGEMVDEVVRFPPLASLRISLCTQPVNPNELRTQFRAWSGQEKALSLVLAAAARKLDPPAAFDANMAAWSLDPSNMTAGLDALQILQRETSPRDRATLVDAIATSTRSAHGVGAARAEHVASVGFYSLLGVLLSETHKCTLDDAATNPRVQWLRAIEDDPVNAGGSAEPRKYLAICYSRLGDRAASGKYGNEAGQILAEQGSIRTAEDKIKFHFRSIVYPGGLVKSVTQAALLQWIDTPGKWGQGFQGYGKRLGSSALTRGIRQYLALTFDAFVYPQDPHYLLSPEQGAWPRLGWALKQTFVSRDRRLNWRFALWRVGSAFGSEFTSQFWRPRGSGIGDRNSWSWLPRGSFVLAGDTASDVLREFLPRKKVWGKIFRHFI